MHVYFIKLKNYRHLEEWDRAHYVTTWYPVNVSALVLSEQVWASSSEAEVNLHGCGI